MVCRRAKEARMAKKHVVDLTDGQRQELDRLVNTGRESARKITRARILLKAGGGEANEAIAAALGVGLATVERVRRGFAEGGMGAAVEREPQPPRPARRGLGGSRRGGCSPRWSGSRSRRGRPGGCWTGRRRRG